MEGRILRGECQDLKAGNVNFGTYAGAWITDRRLEPRSRELYEMLLRLHLTPWFGPRGVNAITPSLIRAWRTDLLATGRSEVTAAKAYRLLRAILKRALKEDRLITENPCRMRGFDKEPTTERPTATVGQVGSLSGLMPPRYRALVLFAAFTGPRWGELAALRHQDIDLDLQVVQVLRKFAELSNGKRVPGRPKSDAGFRSSLCRQFSSL